MIAPAAEWLDLIATIERGFATKLCSHTRELLCRCRELIETAEPDAELERPVLLIIAISLVLAKVPAPPELAVRWNSWWMN